ncbi:ABC transporter ATP-binding protein [Butyrivibrio sp. MC2021]|uniref:ABC transporter ATP-binding protein n=1 Tax=Butyrivibrio sp. MC2021 TaxID=1408306 RepID=UPI0006865DE8|nr:ABC transporter ATP-binding protein [Butyrivibrio sp. MC2021]
MSILKKINYLFDRKQKLVLFGNLILALLAGFFELLSVSALLPLINVILDSSQIDENKYYKMFADLFNAHDIKSFVICFSIFLIILYILKNTYLMFRFKIQQDFVFGNRKRLALRLMDCYLSQDYLFHVEHAAPELQRNVYNDVLGFMNVISAIVSIAVEVFTFGCMMVFLFVTDAITTILMGSIFVCVFLIIFKIYRKYQVRSGEEARAASADLNKWMIQSFGGIKELKVLNRERFFLDNFDGAYKKYIKANRKNNLFTHYPKYITEMLIIAVLLVTIIIRMNMNVDVKNFAATLSAFALAAIRMLPAFNRMTEYVSGVMYGKASVDAIYEDIVQADSIKKNIRDKKNGAELEFKDTLKVDNVSFKYPEGDKPVFVNACLSVEKNQSIALIGESGAGKTTLADIMLGLLTPQNGTVTVDGKDVFKNEDAWHRSVGYIPQMIYLIDDTIRANVTFGHENVDDERVWAALKDAQLDEYVRSLSKGLDTVVGDRGVKLSGGQRQRIGIARALYAQPSVLFLDEATSALDSETESAVMESIEYLQGKTTLIIIAHRLTTIRNCDAIFEVGGGVITKRDKKEVFEEESLKLRRAANDEKGKD